MKDKKSTRLTRREFLRLAGIGAAGAAAASALGSCAPRPTPTAVPKPPPPTAVPTLAPTVKPTDEIVTLRYQNHWTREGDAHYTSMNWVYKTFQERYPNIKLNVVVVPVSDDSTKKIIADCTAGDCPDIVHEVYMDYFDAGWLIDLAPYLDAEWKSRLIPEVVEENSWEGKTFGVSVEYSPMTSIWNMATLDAVGKPISKTWDEFLALGDALKSKDMYLTSFKMGIGYHGFTALCFGRPGAAEAMAKGEWECDQALYAWKRLKELVDNKFIPPNETEVKWRQIVPLFQANKMAMYPNGAWHIGNAITAEGADPELRNHVAFTAFPSTSGGLGKVIQLMNATALGLGSQLAKQPKRLEAAIQFLKFITSTESAEKFIIEAQSPLGVKADVPADKVPLLAGFLGATKDADVVFSLPRNKRLRALAWDYATPGYTALLLGKSAEEALATYAAELRK